MKLEELQAGADRAWKDLRGSDGPVVYVSAGTCGMAAGAGDVRDRAEEKISDLGGDARVIEVGCLGVCCLEPVVCVQAGGNPPVAFGPVVPNDVGRLLDEVVKDGRYDRDNLLGALGGSFAGVPSFWDHPMMKGQKRVLLSRSGIVDPVDLQHYIANGGFQGLKEALATDPEKVIDQVLESGLWGRGGAKFPAGRKWKFTRDGPGEKRYVICNGSEGDPGSFMDRTIMEGDPYAIIEGMIIASYAVGADEAYFYIQDGYPLSVERVGRALARCEEEGFLGEGIQGSGFNLELHLKPGSGAFVCGEETALMEAIEGKRGNPRLRPPFPPQRGLFGHPTVINNIKTLSTVPWILKEGPGWYSGLSTADTKLRGTAILALTGALNRTGVIEVPMGTPMSRVIDDMGGGIAGSAKLKAVQTESPLGGILPASAIEGEDGEIVQEDMGMVVMSDANCMVDMARAILSFTQGESCGKCSPCRLGTKKMKEILTAICSGQGREGDLERIRSLAWTMQMGSICGLGQAAARPVLCTMDHFADEYDAHLREGRCPAGVCDGRMAAAREAPPPDGGECHG